MKIRTLVILAAILGSATFCRADITNTTFSAYSDGVMSCKFGTLTPLGDHNFQQSVDADQYIFATGDMWGDILSDSDADPSLTLNHTIDNDTAYIWTDYHLTITLDKTFTLSGVNVANPGWYSVVTAPSQVGSDWIGYIDYYSGTPVGIGQILNFGYTMTFTGSASFSEDLTPTTSVPEPTAAGCFLLGLGALAVCQRFTKNRRSL